MLLSDFEENEYYPIGLVTGLEIHQLAYQLNEKMGARFHRKKEDLQPDQQSYFQHFLWADDSRGLSCHLIANHCWLEQSGQDKNSLDLFELSPSKKVSLLPEFEKLDFFVVQEDWEQTHTFLQAFKQIPAIQMSQVIRDAKHRSLFQLIWD